MSRGQAQHRCVYLDSDQNERKGGGSRCVVGPGHNIARLAKWRGKEATEPSRQGPGRTGSARPVCPSAVHSDKLQSFSSSCIKQVL